MRRIEIEHSTTYDYPEPVQFLKHRLMIRPREGHDIRIESSRLVISPTYSILWYRDVYGNSVAAVDFDAPAKQLSIVSQVIVQHYEVRPVAVIVADEAKQFPFHYDPMEQIDLMIYLLSAYPQDSGRVGQWLREVWTPGSRIPTLELLDDINQKIVDDIGYEVRELVGVQSPAETLARGKGSCRDVATLFIEACRHCGLAARFVSGYLLSSAAVKDVASTHAWSEVYLPAGGWRGFDSTSGRHVGGEHVAVAVHRHPQAIPPISGAYLGPEKPRPVMHVEVHAKEL
jgi:transglutaminase-like putative cysteine protease